MFRSRSFNSNILFCRRVKVAFQRWERNRLYFGQRGMFSSLGEYLISFFPHFQNKMLCLCMWLAWLVLLDVRQDSDSQPMRTSSFLPLSNPHITSGEEDDDQADPEHAEVKRFWQILRCRRGSNGGGRIVPEICSFYLHGRNAVKCDAKLASGRNRKSGGLRVTCYLASFAVNYSLINTHPLFHTKFLFSPSTLTQPLASLTIHNQEKKRQMRGKNRTLW